MTIPCDHYLSGKAPAGANYTFWIGKFRMPVTAASPAFLCCLAAALIIGRRLSPLGQPAAMPSSIHARLRFSPSKCASLGSLGSGDTTGGSQEPFFAREI